MLAFAMMAAIRHRANPRPPKKQNDAPESQNITTSENGRAAQKGLNGSALQRSQLDVLEGHLTRQNKNYAIVFVHGPQPIASPIHYTWQTHTSRIKRWVSSCRRY
jgi:hypothetical protein